MLRPLRLASRRLVSNTEAKLTRAGPLKALRACRYSSTSPPTGSHSRLPLLAFAAGSILSGSIGYYLANRSSDSALDELAQLTLHPASTDSGLNERYGTPADFREAIEELKRSFPDEDTVTTDSDDLEVHGNSENDYHPGSLPSVVVFPRSTEDVVKIVKISRKYRMPVIPYSGATSLEGHYRAPASGSICVDMSHMDKILEIHEADSDLVCQPGARWMDINAMLKQKGIPLFFPLDPAPGATIGGMVSTGCSGTNAVRYGTAKAEWFLNLTVVLPNGEVIKTRRRSRKSSAGFDTTKLFVGAEGTLGIITEVTIRLAPLLPTNVAVCHFPDVKKATEAVSEIMNQGVGIQCVELVDDDFMRSTNLFGMSQRKWPEKDSLFFKFQGPTPTALKETARIVRAVSERHGGFGFTLAASEKEANDLWADRKNALYSGLALVEGCKGWSTDVCVRNEEDIAQSGIVSTIVGHVGDGNFHALLLFKTDEELAIIRDLVHRMVERAIDMDGTCTGEHGVGIGKREYLYDELGAGTVELMKTIKRTLDPLNLFNPGKLYPSKPETEPHLVASTPRASESTR